MHVRMYVCTYVGALEVAMHACTYVCTYVGALEVAVNDVAAVNVAHACTHVRRNGENETWRCGPRKGEREITARAVLQDQPMRRRLCQHLS